MDLVALNGLIKGGDGVDGVIVGVGRSGCVQPGCGDGMEQVQVIIIDCEMVRR